MESKEKTLDKLVLSVTTFLSKAAEDFAIEADQGEMLNDSDYEFISRRVISELAINSRVKLHSDIFLSEIETLACKLAESAIQNKIKKATQRAVK